MNNLGRKIEIFIVVVVIAVIGIVYAFKKPVLAPTSNQNNQSQTSNNGTSIRPGSGEVPPPTQQVPTMVVEYKGVAGKNALELLKASHTVEAKHYSFGDLVTGIDGVSPDPSHFWAMYVNGNFSQVGASSYITKSTDTIKWEIDEIKN
jgi:hypothetical protein